jgi:transposase
MLAAGRPSSFGTSPAAWLALTPRQYTTGGKIRLGRITKKGDAYCERC